MVELLYAHRCQIGCIRCALFRNRRRSSPGDYRRVCACDRINLSDAYPQIPIIKARNTVIEQTDPSKTCAPKDGTAAGNEIATQEFPKDIAGRALLRI